MKRLAEQKDDNSRSNDNADDDLGGLDYRTIACTSPTQLTAVKPAELQVWEREITKQYGGREREREDSTCTCPDHYFKAFAVFVHLFSFLGSTDDQAQRVQEWLEWHSMIGIEQFYL